jgi:hypothetical protein
MMQIKKKVNDYCIYCGSRLKLKYEWDEESLKCTKCKHEYIIIPKKEFQY